MVHLLDGKICFQVKPRFSFVPFERLNNGLNPKIKSWILICCPYSFPTEVVGGNW